jgi:signal transduction histidine kinase
LKRELAAFKKATHIARQLPKASSDELLGKVAKDMQLLSGVIGPIAHHINNSLAVVSGYLSMATASPELEPYERRFVEAALNECQKQKLFVQRLLWASEEGPREMRPVALETVVSRAIEEIRTVLRSGIELSLGEIAKELRVYGDQAALTYALEGLLINAIHAISKSGAITVSVRTTFVERTQLRNAEAAPDTYAVVEVQDSGVGVSIEQLEEMCTFFASPAGEPNTEGLGLSVAFGVARAHHGWLELESSPGSGSRIRMLLPVLHTH